LPERLVIKMISMKMICPETFWSCIAAEKIYQAAVSGAFILLQRL